MFKFFKSTLVIFFIFSFAIKTIPLISGGVFPDSANTSKSGFSAISDVDFHHKVPVYVIDFLELMNISFKDQRFLMLPDGRFNNYQWGIGGAADFLIDNISFVAVYRDFGEGFSGNSDHKLVVEQLLLDLQKKATDDKFLRDIALIFKKLRIDGLVVRLDLNCKTSQCRISKEKSEDVGKLLFKKSITFGDWIIFYNLNDENIKTDLNFINMTKISSGLFTGKLKRGVPYHFGYNSEDVFVINYTDKAFPKLTDDHSFGFTIKAQNPNRIIIIYKASLFFIGTFLACFVTVLFCVLQLFKKEKFK